MPTKKRRLEALYESEANMEGGGFFQNLLKRVFIGVSDMIVRPTGLYLFMRCVEQHLQTSTTSQQI